MQYYKESTTSTLANIKSTKKWLTLSEVKKRQSKYGLNTLKAKKQTSAFQIFLNQFKSTLIWILLAATLVSALIWEVVDSIVILIIVVLNAIFGFIQEYKADKDIESLKQMMNPKSTVIRNNKKIEIDSNELTIWDILVIEKWNHIAADGRLIEVVNLEVLEASLTGESLPVQKHTNMITKKAVLGDQKNMIFSGTSVTKWRGLAVITAIWMNTEIWKIAKMIQAVPDKETQLQIKLEKLSKWLWIAILAICVVIFFAYYFIDHETLIVAFLTAIALAVAAIPEWLPAVVTISLALWVKRMVKKNVLMRRLSSVETLGSVDVICTDKTGTLTKNEMTVTKIFVDNTIIQVSWTGYSNKWAFSNTPHSLNKLLEIWMICNQAAIEQWENKWINVNKVVWDPTEWCLLISAMKAWLNREKLLHKYKRINEMPFDSKRKMMTVFYKKSGASGQTFAFSKWAPEILIEKCDRILINGKIQTLTQVKKQEILHHNELFAKDALRVLWFAYKTESLDKLNENNLIFVGLQAMIDPPREEAKEAIITCNKAWIRVIMITWDNIVTAQAIANELWIYWDAIQGIDLDNWQDLKELLKTTNIFARVNPVHKQQIIMALKEMWHVTSMTGDGVNDAPALKQADIWVAMWITGTDVSKEAADMILLDDNFATIVAAVEEGRWIFDNIKNFVNYLLSTNFGEIMIILTMSLLWLPLPLLAIQILWVNLVTDGLPAIALWVDPIAKWTMSKKPRSSKEWIITKDMIVNIIIIATLMTLGALYIFYKHYKTDLAQARTWVFVLMVLMELVRVQIIRAKFGIKLWVNKWLIWALAISIGLLFMVIYTPLSSLFKTTLLSHQIWIEIFAILWITIGIGMITNWIANWITKKQNTKKIR